MCHAGLDPKFMMCDIDTRVTRAAKQSPVQGQASEPLRELGLLEGAFARVKMLIIGKRATNV